MQNGSDHQHHPPTKKKTPESQALNQKFWVGFFPFRLEFRDLSTPGLLAQEALPSACQPAGTDPGRCRASFGSEPGSRGANRRGEAAVSLPCLPASSGHSAREDVREEARQKRLNAIIMAR